MSKLVKIYTLSDPISKEVRYIGVTTYKLWQRKDKHLVTYEYNHRANWIRSLLKQGLEPEIELIEEVPLEGWHFWEKYWISQFKTWGFKLTNATEGGETGKISDQCRKACIHANTGRKQTQEIINRRIENRQIGVEKLTMDEEFIEGYISLADAARDLGVSSSGHICSCCKGRRKSYKGFKWRYS